MPSVYGRLTGKPACALSNAGPGATEFHNGLHGLMAAARWYAELMITVRSPVKTSPNRAASRSSMWVNMMTVTKYATRLVGG